MKKIIFITVSGVISSFGFAQNTQTLIDTILKDTLKADAFYKSIMKSLAEDLKKNGNKKSCLFPKVKYDKVVCYKVNEKYHKNGGMLDTSAKNGMGFTPYSIVKGKLSEYVSTSTADTLTKANEEILLDLVNNPLNFHWAECGTLIPECVFVFYSKDSKIVAYIDVGCNYLMLRTNLQYKDFKRMKFGGLEPNKAKPFLDLCEELGVY